MRSKTLTRGEFLHLSLGLVAIGTASLAAGCPAGEGETGACDSEPEATIADNHGHQLEIPLEDVTEGMRVTYGIRGSATHDHSVVLSAEDFERLKDGGQVEVVSSFDEGHDHSITLRCV